MKSPTKVLDGDHTRKAMKFIIPKNSGNVPHTGIYCYGARPEGTDWQPLLERDSWPSAAIAVAAVAAIATAQVMRGCALDMYMIMRPERYRWCIDYPPMRASAEDLALLHEHDDEHTYHAAISDVANLMMRRTPPGAEAREVYAILRHHHMEPVPLQQAPRPRATPSRDRVRQPKPSV